MSLCTTAQVKLRLGIAVADTEYDTTIAGIITGVSALLKGPAGAGREMELPAGSAKRTYLIDVPDRRTTMLFLPVWPIALVDSVKETFFQDWAAVTKLTEATDFNVDYAQGRLVRFGYWLPGSQTIQVIVRDGFAAAGATPGTGETAMPDDVVEAAIQQACYTYQRRQNLGVTGESAGQGGSRSYMDEMAILPQVAAIMQGYARMIL